MDRKNIILISINRSTLVFVIEHIVNNDISAYLITDKPHLAMVISSNCSTHDWRFEFTSVTIKSQITNGMLTRVPWNSRMKLPLTVTGSGPSSSINRGRPFSLRGRRKKKNSDITYSHSAEILPEYHCTENPWLLVNQFTPRGRSTSFANLFTSWSSFIYCLYFLIWAFLLCYCFIEFQYNVQGPI